ncbi:ADP-forming succinate--CoA ligase subunit beta [Ectothiorhodospiraceae bacterium 2226]|nr:ADP-forming succinate--CoA ligase subunit beta [Ectothiorhodospiraceae bacterium 2226]
MNLHEFQAKALLADYGVPVPASRTAASAAEARAAAEALGGDAWVVKAQIHAGARGKAGGVRRVDSLDAVVEFAGQLIGTRLATVQTTAEGLPVEQVLVEAPTAVARELYLSALVDRALGRVVLVVSDAGGMDIEEVAASEPARIHRVVVDPVVGLQPYQCRRLGFALGLGEHIKALAQILMGVYRLFTERDLSLVEINPLALSEDGALLALDAKLNADDNALYRQPALKALRDTAQEDAREVRAAEQGLNYVPLGGDIACMVNGAGLAMATMDLIKLHGGTPANFLDVGGGTTAERVAEAFKLILSEGKVRAILVNIFGGIVRCDLIAEGIIQAVTEVDVPVPVVVRLEGTNAERGRELLAQSGLAITPASGLTEAAEKAVAAAKGSAR